MFMISVLGEWSCLVGTLVMPPAMDGELAQVPIAHPKLLYATANGAMGVLATLSKDAYQHLTTLESNLRREIKGVGDLSHAAYRSFQKQHQRKEAFGVIDGDLVERFLDLDAEAMQRVVEGTDQNNGHTRMELSVAEVTRMVEELARMH